MGDKWMAESPSRGQIGNYLANGQYSMGAGRFPGTRPSVPPQGDLGWDAHLLGLVYHWAQVPTRVGIQVLYPHVLASLALHTSWEAMRRVGLLETGSLWGRLFAEGPMYSPAITSLL